MKAILRGLLVLGALGSGVAAPAADEAPRHYAAIAPVSVAARDGLQRLELPLPVLQAARSEGQADVRLFDARGTLLPMAWAGPPPATDAAPRRSALPRFAWPEAAAGGAPGTEPRLEINAAGAVVRIFGGRSALPVDAPPRRWLLDLSGPAKAPADEVWQRIALDWAPRPEGLSTRVTVEASDDARQWRWVTQTALLELGRAAEAVAQKHIDWPASAGRPKYLRLQFDAPLALTSSELVSSAAPTPAALASQRLAFQAGAEALVWSLDLQGEVPVARLQVHPAAPNTVLALRLEQRRDERQAWRAVASFVAWRLSRDGQESVSPPVDVAAPPARHWRLVADPRTPVPATPTLEASVAWRAPVLVFAARDGEGLRLAVGREKTAGVALPLASLMPGYRAGDEFALPQATLGPLAVQSVAPPGLPQRLSEASPEDRRRWMLWAVLALAVAGLGVLAWRLARDLKKA